jgi:hypothetical protein
MEPDESLFSPHSPGSKSSHFLVQASDRLSGGRDGGSFHHDRAARLGRAPSDYCETFPIVPPKEFVG